MQFEYKGFKFGISRFCEEFHFYSQKMLSQGKRQKPLKAKSLNSAIKEVEKMIDKQK